MFWETNKHVCMYVRMYVGCIHIYTYVSMYVCM